MLPPGHIAGGFLAGKIASQFIPGFNEPQYLGLAAFFGFFPDLDFFLAFLKLKKFISSENINHRKFVTHAPLVYLLIFVIWYLLFPEQQLLAVAFLLGTWSHFIIDSFSADGVQWLYPFSKKSYGFSFDRKIEVHEQNFSRHWLQFIKDYTKVLSFKVEIILILAAIITLILNP
ncbi:MAG: metal-dependent hydrolase [Candidatus Doudnabacteria bacterium]|nr:metal-dependent hydrolase [Candidatus Doudnabacteria bacterium]